MLLKQLSKIEGKFLLSSYPSEILEDYTKQNGWFTESKKMLTSVNRCSGKEKVEVLTGNYDLKENWRVIENLKINFLFRNR
jgi:DNA adenine methylase